MELIQEQNAAVSAGEKPAFFAVIPASVRYNKSLPAGAKLLYGEITALCGKDGFCRSDTAYFASLYDVSAQTIRNWITALRDAACITAECSYAEGSKTVELRIPGAAEQ